MTKNDYITAEVWNNLSVRDRNSFFTFCSFIGIDPKMSLVAPGHYIPIRNCVVARNGRLHSVGVENISYGTPLSKDEILKMIIIVNFDDQE